MTLPHVSSPPQLNLPSQVVISISTLEQGAAIVSIVCGFACLLFGVKVFRVMMAVVALAWGALLGTIVGVFIESAVVGIVLCGGLLAWATWYHTRWVVALGIGLLSASIAWPTAKMGGANPLAAFFLTLAAAVAAGGPILMYYRVVAMVLSCVVGAALVLAGTSTLICLSRHLPLTIDASGAHAGGHLLLLVVCGVLLAVPSFCFQRAFYPMASNDAAEETEDLLEEPVVTPRKKRAA